MREQYIGNPEVSPRKYLVFDSNIGVDTFDVRGRTWPIGLAEARSQGGLLVFHSPNSAAGSRRSPSDRRQRGFATALRKLWAWGVLLSAIMTATASAHAPSADDASSPSARPWGAEGPGMRDATAAGSAEPRAAAFDRASESARTLGASTTADESHDARRSRNAIIRGTRALLRTDSSSAIPSLAPPARPSTHRHVGIAASDSVAPARIAFGSTRIRAPPVRTACARANTHLTRRSQLDRRAISAAPRKESPSCATHFISRPSASRT